MFNDIKDGIGGTRHPPHHTEARMPPRIPHRAADENTLQREKAVEHHSIAFTHDNESIGYANADESELYSIVFSLYALREQLKKLRRQKQPPRMPVPKKRIPYKDWGIIFHGIADILEYCPRHMSQDPYLAAFKKVLVQLGIIVGDTAGPADCQLTIPSANNLELPNLDALLAAVYAAFKSEDFRQRLDGSKQLSRRIRRAFWSMFNRCEKKRTSLRIVLVDLEYLTQLIDEYGNPSWEESNTQRFSEDMLDGDRARFAHNLRNLVHTGGLEHLLDWGWCKQPGALRGWHLHGVFIFDAAECRDDLILALLIGNLWKQLTAGRGTHRNRHTDNSLYGRCCRGVIEPGDQEARREYAQLVDCLAVTDLIPVAQSASGANAFGVTRFRSKKKGGAKA